MRIHQGGRCIPSAVSPVLSRREFARILINGDGGIRTHEPIPPDYPLSKRAHSTPLPHLQERSPCTASAKSHRANGVTLAQRKVRDSNPWTDHAVDLRLS